MSASNVKSIRFPDDLREYIEEQEGNDFTKKLVNLLRDVKDGDAERAKKLAMYDELIAKESTKLALLRERVYVTSRMVVKLEAALSEIDEYLENIQSK